MNHHKPGACSKSSTGSSPQPGGAKTGLSLDKAAGALASGVYMEYLRTTKASGVYMEYLRTTKAPERRWRTLRLREGMLFQRRAHSTILTMA